MFQSSAENFIFNFMDYGAVMGKSLNLALLLTVSLPAVAYAVSAAPAEKAPATASSGIYKLDEEKPHLLLCRKQPEMQVQYRRLPQLQRRKQTSPK